MSDDARLASIGAPGMRTGDKSGGGRDPDFAQPIDNTRSRMLRRAIEALWLLIGVPLLLGPWVLVVYVPRYLERAAYAVGDWFGIEVEVNRFSMACLGALVLVALLVVPDPLLLWWPFWWQRGAATFRGILWPAWWAASIPVVLLLRIAPVVVSLAMWPEVWYLDQRQRQETVDPTRSSMAYDTVHPANVEYPGIHNPYRLPGEEPPTDDTSVKPDIIIHLPAAPEPARVLGANLETGEPSVAVGGNGGNGHHTTTARVPLALLGGDRRHVLDLLRILHDAYGGIVEGEQLSRANLRRHGLSDNQARDLSQWFRDQGYATIDRGNNHLITDDGLAYLGVALAGIEQARQRLE